MSSECVTDCFFQRTGPHQRLHSFPTRRSSDLGDRAVELAVDRADERAHGLEGGTLDLGRLLACEQEERGRGEQHDRKQRSEEHTSELQSRRDLVCRLLLEKKKKTCVQYSARCN